MDKIKDLADDAALARSDESEDWAGAIGYESAQPFLLADAGGSSDDAVPPWRAPLAA